MILKEKGAVNVQKVLRIQNTLYSCITVINNKKSRYYILELL